MVAAAHSAPDFGEIPDPRYQKVSITLPAPLLEQVRQRVGTRGLSRFVTVALEREERRIALSEWLADMDDRHGPVPAAVMEEVRREWPADHDRG